MALLDSNIIIYACDPQCAFLNAWIIAPDAAVSRIVIPEVLGYHSLSAPDEEFISGILQHVRLLDVSGDVLHRAAALRRSYRMKLGDAIIAATALEHGLALVTRNVSDFKGVRGLEVIDPFGV